MLIERFRRALDGFFPKSRQRKDPQQDVLLERMIRILEHEIQNPISVARNLIERLRRKSQAQPDILRDLAEIEEQLRRLRGITDVLQYFHLTDDYYQHFACKTNLTDLVARSISAVKFQLPERSEIQFVLSGTPLYVRACEAALKQVFSTVLKNAVDALLHSSDRTPVKVVVSALNSETACVVVTDHGCGMAESRIGEIGRKVSVTDPCFWSKRKSSTRWRI